MGRAVGIRTLRAILPALAALMLPALWIGVAPAEAAGTAKAADKGAAAAAGAGREWAGGIATAGPGGAGRERTGGIPAGAVPDGAGGEWTGGIPAGAVPDGASGGEPAGREMAEELARRQAQRMDLDPIGRFWDELRRDYGGYFPEGRMPGAEELLFSGGKSWNWADALGGLARFFLHEVLAGGRLILTIVLLAVFVTILETMQSAFERNTVSRVAYAIAYMVLIVLAVNSFRIATGYAGEAISRMIHFMLAMVPLLLTLMVSVGGVTTAAMLHPLIVFMVHAVGTVVHLMVFPLLFFSAVLHLVSAISERFKLTQLGNLLRSAGVYLLGGMLTLFLGVITVQGAAGAVTDGVALRTAKFVSSNFIPVVGRMFSDAADTVLSASLLVKNAIGLAGVVILLFLCAFPALKVMAMALIFNVSAAVLQPLGDSPLTACLQTIGKTLVFIFAAMASVALMFFLAVTIILMAGNAPLLMR